MTGYPSEPRIYFDHNASAPLRDEAREAMIAALEAGVQGLRLSPGNIREETKIKQVAVAAKERGIPIRIGVNAGSLGKDLQRKYGEPTAEALVNSWPMITSRCGAWWYA